MTDTLDDGEDFTELVDADFGRVDLVGKGANGIPFLVAKADASGGPLLPADLVRSLINTDRPEAVYPKGSDPVTISGSPAAVMKMIHEAAIRQASTTQSEGGPAVDDVKKDADPVAEVDVEVTDVVATAAGGTTAESTPGSPDWENLDADTALNAIGVLARVKGALQWLSEREATEDITSDSPDELNNSWDMSDAASALDCIIKLLSGYATTERLEAEMDGEMEAVGKAVAGLADVEAALRVLETYGPVVKAGRVLSATNEASIRSASDSLQKVLASLPAPIPDDQPVAKEKETAVDEDVTKTEAPDAPAEVEKTEQATAAPTVDELKAVLAGVAKSLPAGWVIKANFAAEDDSDVEKAKGDPQVAVYDASGNLVGTIDPKDLSPIASATPPEGGDADGPATTDDLTPAPADDAGTPTDVAPAAAPAPVPAPAPAAADDEPVAKSTDTVLKEMLDAHLEAALKDHPVVKALEAEIEHLKAPAPSRVLVNGAQLPADLRGMGNPAAQVDVAKADDLRAQLDAATTVAERESVMKQMNELASAGLEAIRAQGVAGRSAAGHAPR